CRSPWPCRARSRQGRLRPRVQADEASGPGFQFGGKSRTTATLHFVRELSYRFLRDRSAHSSRERGLRRVHSRKDLGAGTLAVFPQGQRFAHSILFTSKPSAGDRVSDKGSLIGG